MKIVNVLPLITSLTLAAGCTYNQRHPGYSSTSPYGGEVISSGPTAQQINDAADRALEDRVRQQFNRYGDLSALAPYVQVSARNGTVTLNGTVPTEQERKMVDGMVEATPGVQAVSDQLQVSSAVSGNALNSSGTPLANRVRQALITQPG